MPLDDYSAAQQQGSEYGGVDRTMATVQPKGAQALSNGDKLRLGYLTGVPDDPETLEDHRQFWGLRPADGARPFWVENTGMESEAQVQGVGQRDD